METAVEYLKDYITLLTADTRPLELKETGQKELAKAIETVLNRIKELEMEIQVLENTRNSCPCIKTSGVSCDLKSFSSNDCISADILAQIDILEELLKEE